MVWVFHWRVVLGIGTGGDNPISAAIVAETVKFEETRTAIGMDHLHLKLGKHLKKPRGRRAGHFRLITSPKEISFTQSSLLPH